MSTALIPAADLLPGDRMIVRGRAWTITSLHHDIDPGDVFINARDLLNIADTSERRWVAPRGRRIEIEVV